MKDHENRWERGFPSLSLPVKAAFFSTLIVGFLVHLYVFSNIIPNSDGLSRVFDEQQMTVSGRWFLHYASMLHGFVQAPAMIGVLSLCCLAVSSALTADVLRLRRVASGVLCGGALVVIPALAYTYLYMFTASAYALSILMAVASVWLVRKRRWGFFPAAVLLACSIGTYQAYFSVAASLGLMCVVADLLEERKSVKNTVRNGFRLLGMLALAAILYDVTLQIFLRVKGLELLDYRGISAAGEGFSLRAVLGSVLASYQQIISYFLIPQSVSFSNVGLTAVHWLLALMAGAAFLEVARRNRVWREKSRLALLIVGVLLMPMALNFTRILSQLSPNMCYSFCYGYVLVVALMDRVVFPQQRLNDCLKRIACVAGALVLLFNAQICNLVYTSSATAHRATEAFATNLVGRVEQTPGYRSGMEVVIIGTFPRAVYHTGLDAFLPVEHYSCMADTVMQLNKHVYYYLNDWLNVPWEEPEEETMISVSDSPAFQQMPLYPDDGSVRIEGDRVIVKLAPKYIPKKPFEIAYDQRK